LLGFIAFSDSLACLGGKCSVNFIDHFRACDAVLDANVTSANRLLQTSATSSGSIVPGCTALLPITRTASRDCCTRSGKAVCESNVPERAFFRSHGVAGTGHGSFQSSLRSARRPARLTLAAFMKETTVHSLIIARTLLDRAEPLCTSNDRYLASAGLVILQDALETVFFAGLIERGVDEEKALAGRRQLLLPGVQPGALTL
jgi:hypothetical protein